SRASRGGMAGDRAAVHAVAAGGAYGDCRDDQRDQRAGEPQRGREGRTARAGGGEAARGVRGGVGRWGVGVVDVRRFAWNWSIELYCPARPVGGRVVGVEVGWVCRGKPRPTFGPQLMRILVFLD